MEKKVIIVGAGIAGLTAGCYSIQNGYSTTILESHFKPGGLCTAWKRKGYTFDISMHMLTGAVSGPFHRMCAKTLTLESSEEIAYVSWSVKRAKVAIDPDTSQRRTISGLATRGGLKEGSSSTPPCPSDRRMVRRTSSRPLRPCRRR